MDLQTEAIYKDDMMTDPRRFLPLMDENYSGLYRFVARRIEDEILREQIVRISILDAIGQMTTCPRDVNFLTWLYKLAQGRVAEYARKGVGGMSGPIESPIFDGASVAEGVYDDEYKLKQQAEGYFAVLNYEEKEVVRLKFFEELTDGEVMYIMGFSAGSVGKKIYQVLKRSYEILFGKVDDYAGVYYGELYSFLSRLKAIEKIPVPEVFKLKLKAEVINKLDKMYEDKFGKTGAAEAAGSDETPVDPFDVGSKDPAKAFVYAAKGMSKEEIDEITREYVEEREVGAKAAERVSAADVSDVSDVKFDTVSPEPSGWQKPEDIWAEKFGYEIKKPDAGTIPPELEVESGVAQVASEVASEPVVENIPVQYQTNDEYADEIYDTFADKISNFFDRWGAAFKAGVTALIALSIVVVTVVWFVNVPGPTPSGTGFDFAVNYGDGFTKNSADLGVRGVIEKDLIAQIAKGKQVSSAYVSRQEKVLNINFKIAGDGKLDYVFDIKGDNVFRVKSYKEVN